MKSGTSNSMAVVVTVPLLIFKVPVCRMLLASTVIACTVSEPPFTLTVPAVPPAPLVASLRYRLLELYIVTVAPLLIFSVLPVVPLLLFTAMVV